MTQRTFANLPVSGPAMAAMSPTVDETDQRCLIVRSGATAAGAVVCLDTSPARLAALAGVSRRRAVQAARGPASAGEAAAGEGGASARAIFTDGPALEASRRQTNDLTASATAALTTA